MQTPVLAASAPPLIRPGETLTRGAFPGNEFDEPVWICWRSERGDVLVLGCWLRQAWLDAEHLAPELVSRWREQIEADLWAEDERNGDLTADERYFDDAHEDDRRHARKDALQA